MLFFSSEFSPISHCFNLKFSWFWAPIRDASFFFGKLAETLDHRSPDSQAVVVLTTIYLCRKIRPFDLLISNNLLSPLLTISRRKLAQNTRKEKILTLFCLFYRVTYGKLTKLLIPVLSRLMRYPDAWNIEGARRFIYASGWAPIKAQPPALCLAASYKLPGAHVQKTGPWKLQVGFSIFPTK